MLMLVFATMENSNIIFGFFENNLFNWLILLAFLGWLIAKYLPSIFTTRADSIKTALDDANTSKTEGIAFLNDQKQKIASMEQEIGKILTEAHQVAHEMKQQIEAETQKEIVDFKNKIEQEIGNERRLAVMQLKTAAASAAIRLSEAILPAAISDSAKARLLNQFVEQLKG